jgi:hypothetical protein
MACSMANRFTDYKKKLAAYMTKDAKLRLTKQTPI